ncbi:alpha/beta fold hydrolase [Anaerorhabdus sp.]|jgi:pimeloyl-ACP methyl ester carboxylesterase|uniref:alpha/beta fold hydrolase n=1 Tax=Anaerorhabdus sp. TaxID=1872524 RepID=UPI002FC951CF
MAVIDVMGASCNYTEQGKGIDVVLLHGWGQNTQMMQFIQDHLSSNFRVFNIDFPGFGESSEPPVPWGVLEYTEFLHEFCLKNNIVNPILIGHSFGCRVAIRFASLYPVRKMVLTGAAGIRPKRGLGYYVRTNTYKLGKKVVQLTGSKDLEKALQSKFGSSDYKNTSGVMRQTFVKIVNEDLTPYLDKFDCPVLLVWGDKDDAAPLWMGKIMEEKMKNAGLAIFEGDDHYAYFHQSRRFCLVLDSFFEKDKG